MTNNTFVRIKTVRKIEDLDMLKKKYSHQEMKRLRINRHISLLDLSRYLSVIGDLDDPYHDAVLAANESVERLMIALLLRAAEGEQDAIDDLHTTGAFDRGVVPPLQYQELTREQRLQLEIRISGTDEKDLKSPEALEARRIMKRFEIGPEFMERTLQEIKEEEKNKVVQLFG